MDQEEKKLLDEVAQADAALGNDNPDLVDQAEGAPVDSGQELMQPSVPDYQDPQILGQASSNIQGVLSMAVQVMVPMFPSLEGVYTPETIKGVGDGVAPVAVKHGWLAGDFKYKEELIAIAVLYPVGQATYEAIEHDLRKVKEKPAEDPPSASGAASLVIPEGEGGDGQ